MSGYGWVCLLCFHAGRWIMSHPLGDGYAERPCDACGKATRFGERKYVGPALERAAEPRGPCECGSPAWGRVRLGKDEFDTCTPCLTKRVRGSREWLGAPTQKETAASVS